MVSPKAYFVLSLAAVCLAQQQITALFTVDLNTDLEGGCRYVGLTKLNQLVQDSIDLAGAFMRAIDDYQDPFSIYNMEARRLIDSFMSPRAASLQQDLQLLRHEVSTIQDWLVFGGLWNDGHSNWRPNLYCHHGFRVKKQMSDNAYDNQGNEFNDLNGNRVKIRDIPQLVANQAAAAAALQVSRSQIYPVSTRPKRLQTVRMNGYSSPQTRCS